MEINIDGRQRTEDRGRRTEDGGKCRVKTIFVFASNLEPTLKSRFNLSQRRKGAK